MKESEKEVLTSERVEEINFVHNAKRLYSEEQKQNVTRDSRKMFRCIVCGDNVGRRCGSSGKYNMMTNELNLKLYNIVLFNFQSLFFTLWNSKTSRLAISLTNQRN